MEDTVTTNVIKRNGEEVHFDRAKIVNAITKANGNVERIHQMNPYQIEAIADTIAEQVQEMPHAVNVEDIQDIDISHPHPLNIPKLLLIHVTGIISQKC